MRVTDEMIEAAQQSAKRDGFGMLPRREVRAALEAALAAAPKTVSTNEIVSKLADAADFIERQAAEITRAADFIERQAAEITRLREALKGLLAAYEPEQHTSTQIAAVDRAIAALPKRAAP